MAFFVKLNNRRRKILDVTLLPDTPEVRIVGEAVTRSRTPFYSSASDRSAQKHGARSTAPSRYRQSPCAFWMLARKRLQRKHMSRATMRHRWGLLRHQ
jgi:hypothetical protein